MKLILILFTFAFSTVLNSLNAQSIINEILKGNTPNQLSSTTDVSGCASHQLMIYQNQKSPGYMDLSDDFMLQIKNITSENQGYRFDENDTIIIPVVFHIVYNNPEENIPDSVLINQIELLNKSFRRKNADTINMRSVFNNIVGDGKIEFRLAEFTPEGNPTNGITRTSTSVENFGGILPYGPGQNQQITNWVNDSLFTNYYRLTRDDAGGKNAWDINRYLNIWVGDLRIKEPLFNNFEEIVYFALATPPFENLINWPESIIESLLPFEQGVLIHYVTIGPNNPAHFSSPYNVYNGITTTGKMLVHEIGHYLGLRHIWGDGDCTVDDFIDDTPNCNAHSNWGCDQFKNSCIDNINGVDLPDMIENYMDYSSGSCQNSFTKEQIVFMRNIIESYRPNLLNLTTNNPNDKDLIVYPNPTTGKITIDLLSEMTNVILNVRNIQGQLVDFNQINNGKTIDVNINQPNGIYFIEIHSEKGKSIVKVVKN